ncbi:MAG: hypothetical protein RBS39_03800 [Phycisphaerales bacterium]|jgi:hypothetical protein|nr:hypothetical protein [Phycisphaerales bacterium]
MRIPQPQSNPVVRSSGRRTAAVAMVALSLGTLAQAQPVVPTGSATGVGQPVSPGPTIPLAVHYEIEPMGAWGGSVNAFVKEGGLGFVGSGQRLVTLDLSDPAHPVELGSVALGSEVKDLKVRDGIAYVATRSIASSSNAASYKPEARTSLAGFHVVDVSDPAAPVLLWSNDNSAQWLCLGTEIDLVGDYALLRDTTEAIWYADITDPTHPVLKSPGQRFIFRNPQTGFEMKAKDIQIVGDLAYVSGVGSTNFYSRVWIYDLASVVPGVYPLEPEIVGSIDLDLSGIARILRSVIDGNWAYVLVQDPAEPFTAVYAVDVSDPQNPVVHGHYEFAPLPNDRARDVYGLTAVDGRLYLAAGAAEPTPAAWDTAPGLTILDIASTPGQFALLGEYRTRGSVRGVVLDAGVTYLLDQGGGLIAADTSDPSNVNELGAFHSPAILGEAERVGDLLYVADDWNGFSVLDVSNLAHPTLVGVYQTRERLGLGVSGLDVIGTTVHLAAGRDGLETIDVSDPAHPTLVGAIRFPSESWYTASVCVDELAGSPGRVAYLSVVYPPNQGVFSLDVTNPASLTQLDLSALQMYAVAKFARHGSGRLYATGGGYLNDINGTNPTNLLGTQIVASGLTQIASVEPGPSEGIVYITGLLSPGASDQTLVAVDMDQGPAGAVIGSKSWRNISDLATHPLGMVALTQLTHPGFSSIALLGLGDPALPTVLASAPVAFRGGMTLSSGRVFVGGNDIFVTTPQNAGLETYRVRRTLRGAAKPTIGLIDLHDMLSRVREGDRDADLNADGRTDERDLAQYLRTFTESARE